ncbi:MAG TPA: hypothetical protein VEM41_10210 [Actinomycetota bacterium]|nr:hypothetical protein [Actinomycetota bacterium]
MGNRSQDHNQEASPIGDELHDQARVRGRRGRRVGAAVLLVPAFLGWTIAISVVFASPAFAATVDCSTTYTSAECQQVTPTVQCVWTNADGSHTAAFGYVNNAADDILVNVGAGNRMDPGTNLGQPTFLPRGTSVTAFTVTYTGTQEAWVLVGKRATSNASTPACPSPPVPGFGGTAVFFGTLLLGLPMLLFVGHARRSRRGRRRAPAAA